MKGRAVINAWRNPEYRKMLENNEHTQFNHPSGLQEIEDAALGSITGGCSPSCGGGGGGVTTRIWSCNASGQGQACF